MKLLRASFFAVTLAGLAAGLSPTAVTAVAAVPASAASTACASVSGLSIPHATITAATEVDAGAFSAPVARGNNDEPAQGRGAGGGRGNPYARTPASAQASR